MNPALNALRKACASGQPIAAQPAPVPFVVAIGDAANSLQWGADMLQVTHPCAYIDSMRAMQAAAADPERAILQAALEVCERLDGEFFRRHCAGNLRKALTML